MSCQRLTSYHYPIREQQLSASNSILLSREGTACQLPEILRGLGGWGEAVGWREHINKEQSLDSQSHTGADSNGSRTGALFSETLERLQPSGAVCRL